MALDELAINKAVDNRLESYAKYFGLLNVAAIVYVMFVLPNEAANSAVKIHMDRYGVVNSLMESVFEKQHSTAKDMDRTIAELDGKLTGISGEAKEIERDYKKRSGEILKAISSLDERRRELVQEVAALRARAADFRRVFEELDKDKTVTAAQKLVGSIQGVSDPDIKKILEDLSGVRESLQEFKDGDFEVDSIKIGDVTLSSDGEALRIDSERGIELSGAYQDSNDELPVRLYTNNGNLVVESLNTDGVSQGGVVSERFALPGATGEWKLRREGGFRTPEFRLVRTDRNGMDYGKYEILYNEVGQKFEVSR